MANQREREYTVKCDRLENQRSPKLLRHPLPPFPAWLVLAFRKFPFVGKTLTVCAPSFSLKKNGFTRRSSSRDSPPQGGRFPPEHGVLLRISMSTPCSLLHRLPSSFVLRAACAQPPPCDADSHNCPRVSRLGEERTPKRPNHQPGCSPCIHGAGCSQARPT